MEHVRVGVRSAVDKGGGSRANQNRNAHGARRVLHDEPVGFGHATIRSRWHNGAAKREGCI